MAGQVELLGQLPGSNITTQQVLLAASTLREIARPFVDRGGDQGPDITKTES